MSLLNNNSIQNLNLDQLELFEQMKEVLYLPNKIVEFLRSTWCANFDLLHGDPNTRPEKLKILGSNAVELFELNSALTQFMLTQLSGKRDDIVNEINSRLATLPEFNFNSDGTVTEKSE